jgi:4-amino-4-deoxy-L-arabinose transferase-like glycosyltransferase
MMNWQRRLAPLRYLLLALVAAATLWPGITRLPPFDRDESRYAEATAQMLQSGQFIDIRFQNQPRYLQPAGIYWLQAAAVSALSTPAKRQIWANRVVSALAAVLAVLLTCRIGSTLYGPAAGLLAGVLMAVSVLLGVEARMAKIDATLLAAVLTAQAALLEVWRRRDAETPGRAAPWVFWAANGVGLMLKGPVILLLTFGTLLGLAVGERRLRWMRRLRPGPGLLLMLAIVLPWLIGILVVSHGSFFEHSLGSNFLGKVAHGQQDHGAPPGTYLALFLLTFWPGSLFAARALPWVWANRRAPEVRFLLAWILPAWVVFEAVVTKLPHYVLPTYPAIAVLTAAALLAPEMAPQSRVGRALSAAYGVLWLAVGCVLALAGPALLLVLQHRLSLLPLLAAALAVPLLLQAWRLAGRSRRLAALTLAAAASAVIAFSTYTTALPQLKTIWLSPRIVAAVQKFRPCPNSVLASASFSEPSLVYLLGPQTRLIGAAASAEFLHAFPACNLALVDKADAPVFLARAAALGLTPKPLTTIDGINYSTGRRLALTLYDAVPTAAPPPAPVPSAPAP